MRVHVKKWGNSASVRIPVSLMEAARLSIESLVDIREQDGRLIIELVRPEGVDLQTLIGAITLENTHAEVSFGPPVGREAL